MPFSALLDGESVIAILMSDEQWAQAKEITKQEEERLLVGYTRLPGFARTSALGLRHFAHRKGYAPDYEWAESAEHLALKAELVKAIALHGWQVDTEVPSGPERNWIADVLAERGERRIAFEVQWSKQSAEEYVRRTERYAAEGIECVWFARHMPNLEAKDIAPETVAAFQKVAVFPLQHTERLSELIGAKNPQYPAAMLASIPAVNRGVSLGKRTMPISELAAAVLDRKVKVRDAFSIVVYAANCIKCHQPAAYWHVEGAKKRIPYDRPEQDPMVMSGAKRAGEILDPNLAQARLGGADGNVRLKNSDFSCPHCAALQDRAFEVRNLVAASKQGKGLRFEVPAGEKWEEFLARWEIKVRPQVKLSVLG